MKNNKILDIQNIKLNYHSASGETTAISNMSFDVYENEFLTILGPSGCGKSTILSVISGLLKPSAGKVVSNMPAGESAVGYMLQQDHLLEWRTILQNVLLGAEIQNKPRDKSKLYAEELLRKYGLYDFAESYPRELSGGMRQKAALIRTLATSPRLLLLDEPFSALDYQTRINISTEVKNIIKNETKTAILVSHDISEAINLSDRILIFSKRPSYIKKTIKIDEAFKSLTHAKKRKHALFNEYFDTIWSELNA